MNDDPKRPRLRAHLDGHDLWQMIERGGYGAIGDHEAAWVARGRRPTWLDRWEAERGLLSR